MKVLITGGTGYLGQFLAVHFTSQGHDVAITYHTSAPAVEDLQKLGSPRSFQLSLESGDGLSDILHTFGHPDIVVNCAAISIPRACEADPALAFKVNVPLPLLSWLAAGPPPPAGVSPSLLIHLSTDQVYAGDKSYWSEDDPLHPVNKYGESKVKAEEAVRAQWPDHVVLRSSIIYGPEPPIRLQKSLPLQWMDSALRAGQPADFFDDEYRNAVFVEDVVVAIDSAARKHSSGLGFANRVLNMGGATRLSRADMARVVAAVQGYDAGLVRSVPAASVSRGVKSPPDISMRVERIEKELGLRPTRFEDGVRKTFRR